MNKYCQTCQRQFMAGSDSHIFCSPECAHAQLPKPRYWRDIMDELRPLLKDTKAVALFGELSFSLEDMESEAHQNQQDAELYKADAERYAAEIDGLTDTIRAVQTGWRDMTDLYRAADDPGTVALYQ